MIVIVFYLPMAYNNAMIILHFMHLLYENLILIFFFSQLSTQIRERRMLTSKYTTHVHSFNRKHDGMCLINIR